MNQHQERERREAEENPEAARQLHAAHAELDGRIRAAAGFGPRNTASAIPEGADSFTRTAMTAGVPADLVDVARTLVPEGLEGAALASAVTKLVEDRPGLVAPGFVPPPRSEGLDGGAGRGAPREDVAPSMTDAILIATGRKTSSYKATNGITVQRGAD